MWGRDCWPNVCRRLERSGWGAKGAGIFIFANWVPRLDGGLDTVIGGVDCGNGKKANSLTACDRRTDTHSEIA